MICSQGSLGHNSFFLSLSGELFISGNNENGQCGVGTTAHQKIPVKVPVPQDKRVVCVGSGSRHNAIVTEDGKLYTCGHNDKKQLGINTQQDSVGNFLPVNSSAFFVAVSCGDSHTLALTSVGSVYAFGDNSQGQLGTTSGGLVSQVQTSEKIVAISCGNLHSVFLGESGTVYTCGANSSGQLGQNHLNNLAAPLKVLPNEKAVCISAGYMHTVYVTDTGDVRIFGFLSRDLTFGNLGKIIGNFRPNTNDRLVQLASGSTHILVLTAGGSVYGFGVNGHGQLGLGQNGPKFAAQMTPINGLRGKINYVACGFQHSLCCSDREIFGFGRNERSQLGANNTAHQYSPIQVPLPQGFSLKDIFCLSITGTVPTTSLPANSTVDTETIELTLPERQYHPGFQSFNPQMIGISSETANLPPPTQNFAISKKQ